MSTCPHCGVELRNIPEPKQSKFIGMLQEIPQIKFIVPLKECSMCGWNKHFGKPMTLKELHGKMVSIYGK